MSKKATGAFAETMAQHFLERKGLRFIKANYFSRRGEIDLIFEDNQQIVFIEVKYRQSTDYGLGSESVNYHKQQRIIHTAQYYLHQHHLTEKVSCRFDIISITAKTDQKPTSRAHEDSDNFSIEWIKDAFYSI